jgi:hypothetical protein
VQENRSEYCDDNHLFLWATHPEVTCTGVSIANCVDLSEDNLRLMIEYGAKDK